MEVGYLKYSGASAIGGKVLDEDHSHGRPMNSVLCSENMLNASIRLAHVCLMPHKDPRTRSC